MTHTSVLPTDGPAACVCRGLVAADGGPHQSRVVLEPGEDGVWRPARQGGGATAAHKEQRVSAQRHRLRQCGQA